MRLDFFKSLNDEDKRNNEVLNFIKELDNSTSKEEDVLNKIQNERKVSIKSRNTIRNNQAKIIEENKNNMSETEINEMINKMTNEVLDNQDKKLEEFRKEEHLYMVEEDREDRIFLTDITDDSNNIVLEEVNFPKELIDQATEGTVFQYRNGTYHFYSRDGFERIYNK